MEDITTSKKVQPRIADMETLPTWMLISITRAALAIAGGIIGSWALLAASGACLIIFAAKVTKFYIPLQRVPIGG